jgi:DNA-binding CsgD family transcriptional regulator
MRRLPFRPAHRGTYVPMTDLASKIAEMRRSGLGSLEISHRLGVAQSTVHYHLRKVAEQPRQASRAPGRPAGPGLSTRRAVALLISEGLPRAEIAQRLGLSKSTVSYHARQLGEPIDARFARRFEWAEVQAYYDDGHSVRECGSLFGFSTWTWSQAVRRGLITPRPRFRPPEVTFAAGTRRQRGHLKQRLLLAGLKDGRCERCGLSDWRGQPLSLALHHINGDRYDNRVENLELLCPNCHSQTGNFAGRAGKGAAAAPAATASIRSEAEL